MSFLARLFGRKAGAGEGTPSSAGAGPDSPGLRGRGSTAELGFLLFEQTGDVIAAESLLKKAGLAVEIKGPPPELRKGCDMVLVCPIMAQVKIRAMLAEKKLHPTDFVPMSDPLLEPVSLYRVTDFGDWFMVRAANMKITVEKATGTIVNISGGGCPDVPYLAGLLWGRRLDEAEEPRLQGRTLCSYALQKAFEEARRQWRG